MSNQEERQRLELPRLRAARNQITAQMLESRGRPRRRERLALQLRAIANQINAMRRGGGN